MHYAIGSTTGIGAAMEMNLTELTTLVRALLSQELLRRVTVNQEF